MDQTNPYKDKARQLFNQKTAQGEITDSITEDDYVPTVLVNVGHDDPTRGDAAAWKGLGHHIAKTIGARVTYMDQRTLENLFPDEVDDHSYQQLLARHLTASGYAPPTYVIGHSCPETMTLMGNGKGYKQAFEYNEAMSWEFLKQSLIVSHHLTPEILKEEGALFDAQHPNIKKPIMAVMLVDPNSQEDINTIAPKLAKLMSHYEEATIYLCGSRRTYAPNQRALYLAIQKEIEKLGKTDTVDVREHQFNQNIGYNPYLGLIARSSHFLIWGDSRSMLSEALYAGKTVYHHNMGGALKDHDKLENSNQAFDIHYIDENRKPFFQEFEPYNTSEIIARKIIENGEEQIRAQKDDEIRACPGFKEEWYDKLSLIWENYNFTALMSNELKEDPQFAQAVVSLRGMALHHLPKFQNHEHVALTAITQNNFAVDAIGGELRKNSEFILEAMAFNVKGIEDVMDPVLSHDKEFIFEAMTLGDTHKVLNFASDELKSHLSFYMDAFYSKIISPCDVPSELVHHNENALLDLIAADHHAYQKASFSIQKKPDFARQALLLNPKSYANFPKDVQNIDDIALTACQMHGENYTDAPLEQQKRYDVALAAIKSFPRAYLSLPYSLSDHSELAFIALIGDATLQINQMHEDLAGNRKLALRLAAHRPELFVELSEINRSDTEVINAYLKHAKSTNIAAIINKIPDHVLETDLDFSIRLLSEYGDSVLFAMPHSIKTNPHVALRLIEHDPAWLNTQTIQQHFYHNPDFMRSAVHTGKISEDMLNLRMLTESSARAILEVKPDWQYVAAIAGQTHYPAYAEEAEQLAQLTDRPQNTEPEASTIPQASSIFGGVNKVIEHFTGGKKSTTYTNKP